MSRQSLALLLVVTFALVVVPSTVAQGQGQAKGHGKGKQVEIDDQRGRDIDRGDVRERDTRAAGSIIFSTRDRQIIRDYFRNRNSNLPPGLAKRGGNLPPGLQKHLEKNGTLPPGLQKRLTPFPVDLERRLPRLPDIYTRGSIGDQVIILDRRTQRVMDVIDAITRP